MCIRAVVVCLVAVLGACASQQWHKPGASDDAQARDVEACRRQAREQSFHELNARMLSQPYGTGVDARGHATLAPPLAAEGDRVMIEQGLMHICMRSLGYQLVPRPDSPYAPHAR
jgi:hypothetical protein